MTISAHRASPPGQHNRRIAVIGLGYVGLPIATAFVAAGAPVIGFDIDSRRVGELRNGVDRTREVDISLLRHPELELSDDANSLKKADFFIVTVPTPIDEAHRPDLGAMFAASRLVGAALSPGAIVVFESTVYPGVTEDECVPILEQVSGLTCGRDFAVGYSPERINPGDQRHRLETIVKVVSAQDPATLDIVAAVYGSVVTAGLHRASSIKVAEAAKVIENAQRDLNIAFMNELSSICRRLGIDTHDVITAAATKWNFLPFTPGLVGGHCIGVDPYYLTHCAEKLGYHPEVILAGRRINDDYPVMIAHECVRLMLQRRAAGNRVGILGLTFKEGVPDVRNSKVADIVTELRKFGMDVHVCDPIADASASKHEHGVTLEPLSALGPCDAVILAVPHQAFVSTGWDVVLATLGGGQGIVLDVKAALDRDLCPPGVILWRP
jgi:UDP-N-acetyl-D-galactosamine dehydrogenase